MTREQAINSMISHGFTVEQAGEIIKAVTPQEPTTKNNLGVDCISRAQTQTEIEMNACRYTIAKERGGMGQVEWSDQLIKVSDAVDIIRNLPPVTPQEPRKGHWLRRPHVYGVTYCSVCDFELKIDNTNYCPNCGADMREVKE